MFAFNKLISFPLPEKITIYDSDGDIRTPYERIKSYSDKEFELFIREWVVSLSDKYQVRGFGGAGDMGRDVVAKDEQGNYFYYQCKHYNKPLTPAVMLPEFGKLVFHCYNDDIPIPKEYYILAPCDIGPVLNALIEKPSKINTLLGEKWKEISAKISASAPKELHGKFEKYVMAFDFGIIRTKTMLEVINEHRATAFYAFRFGGGLTVQRKKTITPPKMGEHEAIYIKKLLDAVSEKESTSISTEEELKQYYPQYYNWLLIQRERFYNAEDLKRFASQNLLNEEYFTDLTDDVFYGIYDFIEKPYENGYERLLDVMISVAQIDLGNNLLVKYDLVHPQDRQGICHQIANDRDDFVWTNQK